ncbi:hypothetical protein CDO26_08475 [Sinorhizobium meliloti]|nr:hypothetical protein CDO26_08475 [Sinorhizobium meliloti]ASP91126.1 hypothetical protein CDO25_07930 [Sinorhizobium meliloti]QGJ73888.1 hypothetical protein C3L21_07625 [Sinorhizobium meliloti]RMI21979.1 hypothetical protein DA102_005560 [Sinorhizobium meliloti]
MLVTGIQQRRVCGAGEPFSPRTCLGWIPVTSTGMRVGRGVARPWPMRRFPTGAFIPLWLATAWVRCPVAATAETAF